MLTSRKFFFSSFSLFFSKAFSRQRLFVYGLSKYICILFTDTPIIIDIIKKNSLTITQYEHNITRPQYK